MDFKLICLTLIVIEIPLLVVADECVKIGILGALEPELEACQS
jgi:hypothetical protein